MQILVEVGGVSEKGGELWRGIPRVGKKDIPAAPIQSWKACIAGAPPHDRVVGAEENDGISSGFLDGPRRLLGDAGGEGVRVPTVHELGAQVDCGGVHRVSPLMTGAEHAVGRGRRGWVEVCPNLPEELRHAGNVQGGGFYG